MKKRTKNQSDRELIKQILLALAGGLVLAIPVAGPMAFMLIAEELGLEKRGDRKIAKQMSYLKNRGLIGISYETDKITIHLTEKGSERVLKYNLDDMKLKKPKRWDKKWRIVIFDIPEKHRTARDYLRRKLKELEFYQLQKSVWVSPYPCQDEVTFLREIYEVRPFVTVATVEKIDSQEKLKKHFVL